MPEIVLRVNGADHRLDVEARVTLLDALRDALDLHGTRKGCGHGECGACTVHLNSRRIKACMTFAVMHDASTGDEIVTIEGLADGDRLHPMQRAFLRRDGYQCGYCTPGQIMSAVAMLREVGDGWPSVAAADVRRPPPALDAHEVRERMSGNLCRCGAYRNIVRAVLDVAEA